MFETNVWLCEKHGFIAHRTRMRLIFYDLSLIDMSLQLSALQRCTLFPYIITTARRVLEELEHP
jgi:hypothetical protein